MHLPSPSLKNVLGGSGDRDLGEAQCLALAHMLPAVPYIDDGEGCVVADSINVEYTTALGLLSDAVDDGIIGAAEAGETVDALIATGYKITFFQWIAVPRRARDRDVSP